jgi:hypothetical protein
MEAVDTNSRRFRRCLDAYMDIGGRATHDYRDIGGRVTPGAVTEEAKAEQLPRAQSTQRKIK